MINSSILSKERIMAEIKNQFSLAVEDLSSFTSLKKALVRSVFLDSPLPTPAPHPVLLQHHSGLQPPLLQLSPSKVQQMDHVPEQSCLSGKQVRALSYGGQCMQLMYCRKYLHSKGPWHIPKYDLWCRSILISFWCHHQVLKLGKSQASSYALAYTAEKD